MPAINLSSTSSSPYFQEFNTLANIGSTNSWADDSTISGWYSNRTSYRASSGTDNTGALYSFGSSSSTDRALGSVASGGTNTIYYGASFVNDTASTLSSLDISYNGEQWRNGGSTSTTPSVPQKLDFAYQVGATSLTSGTWTEFDALDFTSPIATATAGALDGNAAANRTALSATLSGLNLAPGQQVWLRWQDVNDAGNDHGLAIDDLSVSTGITPVPGSPILTIEAIDPTAREVSSGGSMETGTFRLTRSSGFNEALTVNYTVATGVGQATNGTDYTPALTGTVSFSVDRATVDIAIAPVDDSEIEGSETVTLTLVDGNNYDLGSSTTAAIAVEDNDVAITRIRDIQGTSHLSPLVGQTVTTAGIVTAKRSNGFYIQDAAPDANNATSEGIFVFTSSAPTVAVGDDVQVGGTVAEFRSGGANSTNLTVTQLTSPLISRLSSGNALPTATILGTGGRAIPNTVIEDDASGSVETTGTFDPANDGIDFYESLEGMLVQVNNATAVSPTSDFGEIWVLADNGAGATGVNSRGGITISQGDFNPERIQIDDTLISAEPTVNVGDKLGTVVGVIDYSFGNFELLNTTPLTATAGGLQREVTDLVGNSDQLTVATFNVENLDPSDGATKFNALAAAIVNNLKSPDIITVEEIQDNNGAVNDSIVDASVTFQTLINAIAAQGGPTYEFRQINPVDDSDGGEPGGNIRVGFLFNSSRVSFVDRPGGTSTSNTTVVNANGTPELSASPGRIDPTNSAFNSSRKPLAGEFVFNGQTVFAIGNHFNSKGGDGPLFGVSQPPILSSEVQREQQATIVRDFVQNLLAVNPNANVVVAGDLNDFQFSDPVNILEGAGLTTLIEKLPYEEQYTYNFEGNAQALDHIMVSDNLVSQFAGFDVVHINSEFADQISDHDPSIARFNLPLPTISITASGNPAEAGSIPGTFTLSRGNSTSGDLVVNFAVNGSASFGSDYSISGADFTNGTATILNGQSSVTVTLLPIDDAIAEPVETIQLTLTASSKYKLGNNAIANMAIADNDFNPINGTNKPDNITGTDANDRVKSGNGDDVVNGGVGDDAIEGENGDDALKGGVGRDTLNGGRGNDLLIGGADQDILIGGQGNDVFRFESVADLGDTISDFSINCDRIDVSQLLSSVNYGRSNPFADNYLNYRQLDGGKTIVWFDRDGSGNGFEFEALVTLEGVTDLNKNSFII
jgi:hypothetical protein